MSKIYKSQEAMLLANLRVDYEKQKDRIAELNAVIQVLTNQLQVDSFYRDECPHCDKSPVMDYDHRECWSIWAEQQVKEAE
jgi:hypothetical protein